MKMEGSGGKRMAIKDALKEMSDALERFCARNPHQRSEIVIRVALNKSTKALTFTDSASACEPLVLTPADVDKSIQGSLMEASKLRALVEMVEMVNYDIVMWEEESAQWTMVRPARRECISLLDQDMSNEILNRLPVKDLVRVRCVSKLWRAKVRCFVRTKPSLSHTTMVFQAKSSRVAYTQLAWLLNGAAMEPIVVPDSPKSRDLLRRHFVLGHSGPYLLVETEPRSYAIYEPLKVAFTDLPLMNRKERPFLGALYEKKLGCIIDMKKASVAMTTSDSEGVWSRFIEKPFHLDTDIDLSHAGSAWVEAGVLVDLNGSYVIVLMDFRNLLVAVLPADQPGAIMRGTVVIRPQAGGAARGLMYFTGREVKMVEITTDGCFIPWTLSMTECTWTPAAAWTVAPEKLQVRVRRGNQSTGVPARVIGSREGHPTGPAIIAPHRVTERLNHVMLYSQGAAEMYCYDTRTSRWGVKRLPKHGAPELNGLVLGHLSF